MQPHNAITDHADTTADRADNALLTVSISQRQAMTVLSADGNIDLLTAPQLTDSVSAALDGQPRCLIIDLTGTSFLASVGMRVLLDAHAAITPGGHFGVVADGPATARPMKLVGLDETLAIFPTLDEAVTAIAERMREQSQTQDA